MKRLLTLVALVSFLTLNITQAQSNLYKDSWGFNFGINYPRAMSQNTGISGNISFGLYAGLTNQLSEHSAWRGTLNFNSLEFKAKNTATDPWTKTRTNILGVDFEYLYNFVPCETLSPYSIIGLGVAYGMLDDGANTVDDYFLDYQFNIGMGFAYSLDDDWKINSEFVYNTLPLTWIDGTYGTNGGGLLGGLDESYMTFKLGLTYTYEKGEKSRLCELYEGVKNDLVDYERIENIVKKNTANVGINKDQVKEALAEVMDAHHKEMAPVAEKTVYLSGVNFEFNSSQLTAESYPVLFFAARTLIEKHEMNVVVKGYTDDIGSAKYNKELSQKRADVVKNYLVARGVASTRITAEGCGEEKPIADNKTADGRALNRRIEFIVK